MTAQTTRKTSSQPVIARSSRGRIIRATKITDPAAVTQRAWETTGNALREAMDGCSQMRR